MACDGHRWEQRSKRTKDAIFSDVRPDNLLPGSATQPGHLPASLMNNLDIFGDTGTFPQVNAYLGLFSCPAWAELVRSPWHLEATRRSFLQQTGPPTGLMERGSSAGPDNPASLGPLLPQGASSSPLAVCPLPSHEFGTCRHQPLAHQAARLPTLASATDRTPRAPTWPIGRRSVKPTRHHGVPRCPSVLDRQGCHRRELCATDVGDRAGMSSASSSRTAPTSMRMRWWSLGLKALSRAGGHVCTG